jgi:hypothetical protein
MTVDDSGLELVVIEGDELTPEEAEYARLTLTEPLTKGCYAHLAPTEVCTVEWDDDRKVYSVYLRGKHDGDGPRLAQFAQRIAELSTCSSCGQGPIRLRSHRLVRLGNNYELTAHYDCYDCVPEETRKSGFLSALRELVNRVRKVGPVELDPK